MKHTPGPWRYRNSLHGEMEIWRHEPNENPIALIAKVVRQSVPLHHGDHACNGQLMAAAPELLEALKEVMSNLHAAHVAGSYQLPDSSAMMAYKAIAKATGEQQC
jgi:hypothetical protein